MEISLIVRLDNGNNVVQRWHHDISSKDVPHSNDSAVHNLGLNCSPIIHNPLTDPAGRTACKHDSAKDPTRILPKKYSKNILVRIIKNRQNNNSKKDLCKNKYRVISQFSPRNFNMAAICISYSKKKNNILTV
jgi:hypothetical protein